MRISQITFPLIFAAILGINAPASAGTLSMHKHSADELKGACAKVGGRFSQGKERYGCGTDCHGGPGTDCIVSCDAGENCEAQVIGGRRPRTLESALRK
ncbi:MAG TPA: hypothetical protein VFC54_05725 [Pseudolabrys sp.]|nr:hypothetical protein [Pseudolabrys sp.]